MTRPFVRAVGVTAAVGAACFGWGLIEAAQFTVRRVELPILPAGGRSIRILHLSDIHLATGQRFKRAFMSTMAALEPDLVVNTGDNIAQTEAIFPLLAAWDTLRLVPGVFVFGSNDYFAPQLRNPLLYLARGTSEAKGPSAPNLDWERLRDAMTEHGWVDLTHRRAVLEVNGHRLAFRGVDDAHLGRDRYERVQGPADETADLNIGVTHAPYLRLLDAMTSDGMDLIFAGHTHGGQVCVPGYGALVTNCDLDRARVKGLSTHTTAGRTAHLHVSAGVGTSPFAPYRFACRPEVTLLTLRPGSR